MLAHEARRGTVIRVRESHWKSQFAGMRGIVLNLWGSSEHVAVDVLLEDGRSELFWLPDLSVVDEDIAVQQSGLVVRHERTNVHNGFKLPLGYNLAFGYNLECDADLIIVRRADGSFVAVFGAGVDLFEIECAVWEDADQQPVVVVQKDTCPSYIRWRPDKNLILVQEGGSLAPCSA